MLDLSNGAHVDQMNCIRNIHENALIHIFTREYEYHENHKLILIIIIIMCLLFISKGNICISE